MTKVLSFLAIAFLATAAYAAEFPDISIKDLKKAIEEKKVVLIDVNGTESWQNGHIPGAVNFETYEGKLASVLPKDKKALVVAYCGGPTCKAYQAAANAAKKLGYKNVKHLSAGISGWNKAGEKTDKGA